MRKFLNLTKTYDQNHKSKLLGTSSQFLQTMDLGENDKNIYINDVNQNSKKKKKRIIIIKKRRHRDGSISKERQTIYKNFGVNHGYNES